MRGCSCRGTAGFAHVSCLAEQAKILIAEAEENKLGDDALSEVGAVAHVQSVRTRLPRRRGARARVVLLEDLLGAAGGGRWNRRLAIGVLGNGLNKADRHEDALSVYGAELPLLRRIGASEDEILITQSNLRTRYDQLGRSEEALSDAARHLLRTLEAVAKNMNEPLEQPATTRVLALPAIQRSKVTAAQN